MSSNVLWLAAPSLVVAAMLSACGGGGGGGPNRAQTFSVSGVVTGLKGTVVLQGRGVNDIQVTSNGPLTLATSLADGTAYAFTVKTQPGNPPQTCDVSNGTGVLTSANVTDVLIFCIDDPLRVTMTSPGEGAGNVSRTQPLVFTFSTALDPTSFTPSEIFLLLLSSTGQEAAPVTAAVKGNQLTVTPSSPLRADSLYLLYGSISVVRGTKGESLVGPATISFRTALQAAGSAVQSRFGAAAAGNATAPLARAAADSRGNALVVWSEIGPKGDRSSVWASRRELGNGWSDPVLIDWNDAGVASHPDVAFDGNGNALAVWEQFKGGCANVMTNRYAAGVGWGTPAHIETSSCEAHAPRIAVNPGGDVIAVWDRD